MKHYIIKLKNTRTNEIRHVKRCLLKDDYESLKSKLGLKQSHGVILLKIIEVDE